MKRLLADLIASLEGFRLERPENAGRCDLFIVETGEDPGKTFEFIESVLHTDTAREIFLTSRELKPEILLKAMRAGVKEFLHQPLKIKESEAALRKFRQRHQKRVAEGEKIGEIIGVIPTRGGIGTSIIATNLAVSLAGLPGGKSVVLVDLDSQFGEIDLLLDMTPAHTWGDITRNISRLDASYLMASLSRHSSDIHVLFSPNRFEDFTPAVPESIVKTLRLLQTMFDFVVMDVSRPLDDLSLKVMELSSAILLISILNLQCMAVTRRFLGMFDQMGYATGKKVRVVINRYLSRSAITLNEAEDTLKQKIFWSIPNDYRTIMSAINQGKPISEVAPGAEITKSFTGLAWALARQPEEKAKKGPLVTRFFGRFLPKKRGVQ